MLSTTTATSRACATSQTAARSVRRSTGLVGAIEIVKHKDSRERFHKKLGAGNRCRELCIDNGLVMRAVGDTMIVSPPLVVQDEHIDELVEKAWNCLDLTAKHLAEA